MADVEKSPFYRAIMAVAAMHQPSLVGHGLAVEHQRGARGAFRGASLRRTHFIDRSASDVRAATVVALQKGGVVVPHEFYPDASQWVEWDIAGYCRNPVPIVQRGQGHMEGSSPQALGKGEAVFQPSRNLAQLVPCRQCPECLKVRQWRWSEAGKVEFALAAACAGRTYFGSLTFAPAVRFLLRAAARARLDQEGTDLEVLAPNEQFRELHRESGHLVTNYLKNLRQGRARLKVKPARFRYLLTVEPHDDWFPHYHLVMHEMDPLKPLRIVGLEAAWPHGLMRFRLARSDRACLYAAKYLSKFSFARVRASQNYGYLPEDFLRNEIKF